MKHIKYLKILLPILWSANIVTGVVPINLTTILLSSIIFGPLFCSFLCPFGFLSEAIYKIGRKIKLPELKINTKTDYYLKFIRYIILALTIAVSLPLILSILNYDPQANINILLQGNILSIIAIIVLILFLFVSLFSRKFYCKYLCFEGAKQSFVSIGRIFNITRTEHCVNCGICEKKCKTQVNILKKDIVTDPSCITCLDCIENCPEKNAISLKPSFSMKKIIIIVTCSLVLFGSIYINALGPEKVAIEEGMTEYSGTALGYKGNVDVSVIMQDDEIIQVYVESHNDDWSWFGRARQVADDIVTAQSTDVDTITSATYSSQGIINATKDALGEPFTEQVVTKRGHH